MAKAMGARMSGRPSWAITEESQNSTIEWTTLWGWPSTSMRSGGMLNNQRASMTSSPLFIMVAESMVIFGPMRQLGWRSASATVTWASFSRGRLRNGPPEAVRIRRRTRERFSPRRAWNMAECSLSTGMIFALRARASRITTSPAVTRVSLLASATRRPAETAASVGAKPAAPTIAETTTSTLSREATSMAPSTPLFTWTRRRIIARSCLAFSLSATETMRGRKVSIWRASSARFPPAASPATRNLSG